LPRIVIDGLRQKSTFNELRSLAGDQKFGVLFIHTPPDLAFEFYRARAGFEIDIHEFLRLREDRVECEVPSMISMADAILYNWHGRNAFRETIQQLVGGNTPEIHTKKEKRNGRRL